MFLADIQEKTLPLTVGRGPVPRHRPRNLTLAGDRPPHYDKKNGIPFTVGRGSVPRHRPRNLTLAGDRPRATIKNASPHRRARACPSPSSAHSNTRGGQAPALREHRASPIGAGIWNRCIGNRFVGDGAYLFMQQFRISGIDYRGVYGLGIQCAPPVVGSIQVELYP